MTLRFEYVVSDGDTEVRMVGPAGAVPVDSWAVEAPPHLMTGVDLAQQLIAGGRAVAWDDILLIEAPAVAALSAHEAGLLGLPPLAGVVARVETSGLLVRPDFAARLHWQRPNGQAVLGAVRQGPWLRLGDAWRRLPSSLYEIATRIDALDAVPPDDLAGRLSAVAALREVLPAAQKDGSAEAPGLLGDLTIVEADAFSLDLVGEGSAMRLVPILHRAGAEGDEPLLPAEQQAAFGDRDGQFNRFEAVRSTYALGRGAYLVLAPPLRKALQEVRRVQVSTPAAKRALFASPRSFLRAALGDESDETVLERVVRETAAYSARVVGLGLWQPRIVPWIAMPSNDWFGPEAGAAAPPGGARPAGIMVGDRRVPLTPVEAEALRARVEQAIGAGDPIASMETADGPVQVPANHKTLEALAALEAARQPPRPREPAEAREEGDAAGPTVLIIRPNEAEVEIEGEDAPRRGPEPGLPACLFTLLKPHQADGLNWLQRAWASGKPGVLLADDMGLGKTLQGLAFLGWLREGMTAGRIARAPMLVVAPTGLLENWRAEHDRHLSGPGLGDCLRAYGRHLAAVRAATGEGLPTLDVEALRRADWVLTTYETLRDHDRDFGAVRFAAALFDEAQKIKTPGIRLTDAAKAMQADFRVAMTGTPVENRLADLWCIIDGIHPAYLDDLKTFSARYERAVDLERLRQLKSLLDTQRGGRPPILLRRLKEDELPDLPLHHEDVREAPMPEAQASAYRAVVVEARRANRQGAVLEALQELRALCLHPGRDEGVDDNAFIGSSARLILAFAMLDEIALKGERALVFCDDLAVQAKLARVIQRRYRLSAPPMIISGEVAGAARQLRVDRFQSSSAAFDVMILSPRAGGVGLTLTRANHVIHLSRWWNPAVEDQCNGRVLRIGQSRPVTIHIPLAVLPDGRPSFDRNLHALLERKRRLMRDALLPPNATDADRDQLFEETVEAA